MKYGNLLKKNIIEKYKEYYIDYNNIKKNINIEKVEFIDILKYNILKVEDFYNKKCKDDLLEFCLFNVFSVFKITKKYNKKNKTNITNNIKNLLKNQNFYKNILNADIFYKKKENQKNVVCDLCFIDNNYMIDLECNHKLCWNCLTKCYLNNYNKCSFCRKDITKNPILLYLEKITNRKSNKLYKNIIKNNKKCIFIGIDGLRPDCLLYANTPNIDKLIQNGSINFETQVVTESFSGPSWCTIFSGKTQPQTEIYCNSVVEDPNYKWKTNDLFTDLNKKNITTYSVTNIWDGIKHIVQNSKFKIHNDTKNIINDDNKTVNDTYNYIKNDILDDHFIFMYLCGVDKTGHKYGFSLQCKEYINYIEYIDSILKDLIDLLIEKKYSIIVSTDHGGTTKKDLNDKQMGIFSTIESIKSQNICNGVHGMNIPQHNRIFQIYNGNIVKNNKKEICDKKYTSDIYHEIYNYF